MFNPHIHHQQQQQQQQQQQFHQHLRQLQQLFQQQPPPAAQPSTAHHVGHHHQTPRTIPVPTQTGPPPRMVNMCQTTQTTLIAPNPMLQSAILMQHMQGNMRGFGMGGQQFRQFFAAGARSSLLGPVPMGMTLKSHIMGFPGARPFHPHSRFFNAASTAAASSSSSSSSTTDAAARQSDRKRDNDQVAGGSTDNQSAAANSTDEATDETATDGAVEGDSSQISEEQLEEPVTKRQKTEGSEEPQEQRLLEQVTAAQSESTDSAAGTQSEGCISQEDGEFSEGPDNVAMGPDDVVMEETKADDALGSLSAQSASGGPSEDAEQVNLPTKETAQDKDASTSFPESQDEEAASEGSNKFYCYLCSITCHNQQNFRSHMNSISHQQRMMEIQHMSNACLVTLLPRVQESLQGASKDGDRKADLKQWCATCHTHFTCSMVDHQSSEEHKLASKTDLSFCAVCQKRFKTSQSFLEHLYSQEHRQKIQERGCETLAKLTNLGTDGFSFEVEAQELQKSKRDKRFTQDDWSSTNEVTLNDMTSDKQYDPDTVYGSSFLDPVAGFICRLCNRFYLFESSALHSHCKSLQHFENLKSYKAMVGEKGEDAQHSTKSPPAADGLRPVTQTADCSRENVLTTDTSEAADLTSPASVTKLKTQEKNQLSKNQAEVSSTPQHFTLSATSDENPDQEPSSDHEKGGKASQVSAPEESPVELPATSSEAADSQPAEVSNGEEEEEEEEAPVGPGRKSCGGRAKSAAKRRSARATNRR